jgi:glycosyltransferase involved in cell wall biosynthesis
VPRVSIIIPCYNAAPWIEETIRSALAQTHADREIIVIDDGSTDDSLRRARSFEPLGVQVVRQSNAGAAAARNHGLRLATGDFIQFLDADDLLAPDKIERQLFVLRSCPLAVASARWGRFRENPSHATFSDDDLVQDCSALEFMLKHTRDARMMHPAAWLVPAEIARNAGPWDERLSLNDDGEYFARILLSAGRIVAAKNAVSFYRSGLPGSLSRRRSAAALESLALSVELISTHLRSAHDSAEVCAALAEYWQRLEYDVFPFAPEICRRVRREVKILGGARLAPAAGRREALVGRLVGWRTARRLRLLIQRLSGT